MITFAATVLLIALAVYLVMLVKGWPMLDDPLYHQRREQEACDHIAWARALVIGERPIKSWVAK